MLKGINPSIPKTQTQPNRSPIFIYNVFTPRIGTSADIPVIAKGCQTEVCDCREQQKGGDGGAKAQFVEQLGIGDQGECLGVEFEVVGVDRVRGVVAEHDHQNTLNEVKKTHHQIETA